MLFEVKRDDYSPILGYPREGCQALPESLIGAVF